MRQLWTAVACCVLPLAAWAAGRGDACSKDAPPLGLVCHRLGQCAIVAVAEGAALKQGERLIVGRPVLRSRRYDGADGWQGWEQAGTLIVRATRGTLFALTVVDDEAALKGLGGTPVPNIRVGDIVCRRSGVGGLRRAPTSSTVAALAGERPSKRRRPAGGSTTDPPTSAPVSGGAATGTTNGGRIGRWCPRTVAAR